MTDDSQSVTRSDLKAGRMDVLIPCLWRRLRLLWQMLAKMLVASKKTFPRLQQKNKSSRGLITILSAIVRLLFIGTFYSVPASAECRRRPSAGVGRVPASAECRRRPSAGVGRVPASAECRRRPAY